MENGQRLKAFDLTVVAPLARFDVSVSYLIFFGYLRVDQIAIAVPAQKAAHPVSS